MLTRLSGFSVHTQHAFNTPRMPFQYTPPTHIGFLNSSMAFRPRYHSCMKSIPSIRPVISACTQRRSLYYSPESGCQTPSMQQSIHITFLRVPESRIPAYNAFSAFVNFMLSSGTTVHDVRTGFDPLRLVALPHAPSVLG